MLRNIIIAVNDKAGFVNNHYLVHRLMEIWAEYGISIEISDSLTRESAADVVFAHLDCTKFSQNDTDALSQRTTVVNGKVPDISKRVISRNLIDRTDSYDGPVIVKSNRNNGGLPEINALERGNFLERCQASLMWKLHWTVSGLLLPGDYKIYQRAADIPWLVWQNPRLVVEKFRPERDGALYCLRQYMFFGQREVGSVIYSISPIVKLGNIVARQPLTEVPAELRAYRREMGIDYGKIDYAVCNGEIVVYDVNRTPTYSPTNLLTPYRPMVETLAMGIFDMIDYPLPAAKTPTRLVG